MLSRITCTPKKSLCNASVTVYNAFPGPSMQLSNWLTIYLQLVEKHFNDCVRHEPSVSPTGLPNASHHHIAGMI